MSTKRGTVGLERAAPRRGEPYTCAENKPIESRSESNRAGASCVLTCAPVTAGGGVGSPSSPSPALPLLERWESFEAALVVSEMTLNGKHVQDEQT